LTDADILPISLKVFPVLIKEVLDRLRALSVSPSYTSIFAETVEDEDDDEEEVLPSSFWEQDEVKAKTAIRTNIVLKRIFVFMVPLFNEI
jgi:hypothetical protein